MFVDGELEQKGFTDSGKTICEKPLGNTLLKTRIQIRQTLPSSSTIKFEISKREINHQLY